MLLIFFEVEFLLFFLSAIWLFPLSVYKTVYKREGNLGVILLISASFDNLELN